MLLPVRSTVLAVFVLAIPTLVLAASSKSALSPDFGRVPLAFERNVGQAPEVAKFISSASGYSVYLSDQGTLMRLKGESRKTGSLLMRLRGSQEASTAETLEVLPGRSNYLRGNDPAKWLHDIAQYRRVRFRAVYPGIDIEYYGNQRRLEYDFVVGPGADPGAIELSYTGADRIRIARNGDLVFTINGRELRQLKPRVYQRRGSAVEEVKSAYWIRNGIVRFQLARYDRSRPLIIDPVLEYATFLGGSGDDIATGIAVDSQGNSYVVGNTGSFNDFPATPLPNTVGGGSPPLDDILNKGELDTGDIFVTKFDKGGGSVLYSTYLGGSEVDQAAGIAVDAAGNAYIAGHTSSADFPGFASIGQVTRRDIFALKLNVGGGVRLWTRRLGSTDNDNGSGIALDSAGNVYVSGFSQKNTAAGNGLYITGSPAGSLQAAHGGGANDAYVAKLNGSTGAITWQTFLGGTGDDRAFGIALDTLSNVYLAGYTTGGTFPAHGSVQSTFGGGTSDGFLTKLNSAGTSRVYSTFLGGSDSDWVQAVAVDPQAQPYVVGTTGSSNFPGVSASSLQPSFVPGTDTTYPSRDAFIAKLNAAANAFVYATYGGGVDREYGLDIEVDVKGYAYVVWKSGKGFVKQCEVSSKPDGSRSACGEPLYPKEQRPGLSASILSKINPTGNRVVFSFFFGDSTERNAQIEATSLAVRSVTPDFQELYMAGVAISISTLPVTQPLFPFAGGSTDAFLAKFTNADLRLTKKGISITRPSSAKAVSASREPVGLAGAPGGNVTFTMTVSSLTTGQAAENVDIASTLPPILTLTACAMSTGASCLGTDNKIKIPPDTDVSANTPIDITITAKISNSAEAGSTVTLDFLGKSENHDPNHDNNVLTESFSILVPVTVRTNVAGLRVSAGGSAAAVAPVVYEGETSTSILLQAPTPQTIPDGQYAFTSWSDGSTQSERSFTVPARAVTMTANFTKCAFTLSRTEASQPAAAGNVLVNVTSLDSCAWTVSGLPSWITSVNGLTGSGTGAVSLAIAANAAAPRSAVVSIAGINVTISQSQANCVSVSPTQISAPANGLAGTVSITASCAWSARSGVQWAQVGRLDGSGSFTMPFTVFPNFQTGQRTATFTIGGQVIQISQTGSPGSADERFVRLIYFNVFGRLPSQAEVAFQVNEALNKGVPRPDLALGFFNSAEFALGGRYVAGAYVGLLDRDAEYGGWLFQRNAVATGQVTQIPLVANFLGSPEYTLRFGSPSNAEFTRLLYRHILLREATQAEVDWRVGLLTAGSTRTTMASDLLNSQEFRSGTGPRLTAFLLYAVLLQRDGSAAERTFWADRLRSGTPLRELIAAFLVSPEFGLWLQ